MQIEMLVRWSKLKAPDHETIDEETKQLIRLGLKDEPEQDKEFTIEHEYGPMTIDLDDIRAFNQLDTNHTVIRTTEGIFNVKCTYRNLKYIKEFFSGNLIRNVEDFQIDEHLVSKTAKVNQILAGLSNGTTKPFDPEAPKTTTD